MINADKPNLWKQDIGKSVDLYNEWFLKFAPHAFQTSRNKAIGEVMDAFRKTKDLSLINPQILLMAPKVLGTLRMATAPPIARDRLAGLSRVTRLLIEALEQGSIPRRMPKSQLLESLDRICHTILRLLDRDLFPWLDSENSPDPQARERAATVVADRLCGSLSDPIIRNAQEKRQFAKIQEFLAERGYVREENAAEDPRLMKPGTFAFHRNVTVKLENGKRVNIPIDVAIQPKAARVGNMPILIEAKSAGDFTNVNKRRKEEATKIRQLKYTYGQEVRMLLFLCGYFDTGYLGYEAAEGLDWIWEHRIEDLDQLGI